MRIKSSDFYKEYNIDSVYEKVAPRYPGFDYTNHKYAIYVYLDPFTRIDKTIKFDCCGKNYKYHFYFEPFYIGKLENQFQYRHNQHLNKYMRDIQESLNQYKFNKLKEIENTIRNHKYSDPMLPSSMEDYKNNWIIVLKVFDNPMDTRKFEEAIIKAIGVQRDNSGPLTNIKKGN